MKLTEHGFIEVEIDFTMRVYAQHEADQMGELRNSIRGGQGNYAGFLGEQVVLAAFPKAEKCNTYEYDLKMMGKTFEVKTKDRTVPPIADYEASVANHNPNQNAEFYIFVSLLREGDDYTKGYICGYTPTATYFRDATFLTEGEVDPSNGWTVLTDCYNLPYKKLRGFTK